MLENIFLAIGGLGLLLFGMKMMSTGLEVVAGDRLHGILKKATANRFFAITVGVLATIVINSSTAVSIIVVGFVNSGLMNLTQAIGIIMGVNVGTTFSAQLIAFRIDTIAPLFIFVGIVMHLFFKKSQIRNIGYVILGFGMLLFSITVISTPLRTFAHEPGFQNLLVTFQNPVLALLAGFLFTVIVQSSSATMGLLVTMHLSGIPITFETSAFIVLGANIGTSITTLIASIPASKDSKRVALFHMFYSVIGSIVFGTLIVLVPGILTWFQTTWATTARQVAMFHTLFNVATLVLLLPCVPLMSRLMKMIIPVGTGESNNMNSKELLFLNNISMQTSTVAVLNAQLEVKRMGTLTNENLQLALESFFEEDELRAKKVLENEKIINYLYQNITAKLVDISNMTLSFADTRRIGEMFGVVSDIERIADHAENIAEYTIDMLERNMKFSDEAISELRHLGDLSKDITAKALNIYDNNDTEHLANVIEIEEKVDRISSIVIKKHVQRLKNGICEPKSSVLFNDMIINLERIGDHAENIAMSSLEA